MQIHKPWHVQFLAGVPGERVAPSVTADVARKGRALTDSAAAAGLPPPVAST